MIFSTDNVMWQFVIHILDVMYGYLITSMNFMIDKLMKFPLVTQIPEIKTIWQWMLILSVMFISLIICWQILKSLTSSGHANVEIKQLCSRTFYMFGFIIMTFPFVDWLVMFNNILIEALITRFDVRTNINMVTSTNPFTNDLFAGVLIIIQLFFIGKIVLGYYLRVVEINFAVVVSPALYVLWINQGWSGYISQWITRITTLIFSQFIQVLVLVIYSQMFHKYVDTGTWDSLFMALAALVTMDQVPSVVQSFTSRDNAGSMALRSITGGANKVYKTTQFVRDPKSILTDLTNKIKSGGRRGR